MILIIRPTAIEYFPRKNVLNIVKCSLYTPEVRYFYYVAFIYDPCLRILSTRILSHIRIKTFEHIDLIWIWFITVKNTFFVYVVLQSRYNIDIPLYLFKI